MGLVRLGKHRESGRAPLKSRRWFPGPGPVSFQGRDGGRRAGLCRTGSARHSSTGRWKLGRATRRLRACPSTCQSDRLDAAYRRTDLFERRRALMQEWAGYGSADRSGGSSTKRGLRRQAVRLNSLQCAKTILREIVITYCLTINLSTLRSRGWKGTGGVVTCRPLTACCVAKKYRSEPG